jgi:hypothetical protein
LRRSAGGLATLKQRRGQGGDTVIVNITVEGPIGSEKEILDRGPEGIPDR